MQCAAVTAVAALRSGSGERWVAEPPTFRQRLVHGLSNPSVAYLLFVIGGLCLAIELSNPGLISIPIGFLAGWLGTILSTERDIEKYAELEVRALTGHGAH